MTRIDPSLIVELANALQTPARSGGTQRKGTAASKAADGKPRAGNRSEQLLAVMRERIDQLKETSALSDDDVLTMAIQETLAMELGAEIASHPRFTDVVRQVRVTLGQIPEVRRVLPLLAGGRD